MVKKNIAKVVQHEEITFVVHGEIREDFDMCIAAILAIYPKSPLIIVTYSHQSYMASRWRSFSQVNFVAITDPGESSEFGHGSKNYLRHVYSAYMGINSVYTPYVCKVRSDLIIKKIIFPYEYELEDELSFFFDSEIKASPIFTFPVYLSPVSYFYGDMLIFGKKESLLKLFNPTFLPSLKYINTIREPIVGEYKTYLTSEEIIYLGYVKSLLPNFVTFDDLLANDEIIDCSKFIRRLECDVQLPKRIDSYFRSFGGKLFFLFMRNEYYKKIRGLFK